MNDSPAETLHKDPESVLTLELVDSIVKSHLAFKRSFPSSYDYGFSCDECKHTVNARDRKKLVRKEATRTLCWDCMDAGADLYATA